MPPSRGRLASFLSSWADPCAEVIGKITEPLRRPRRQTSSTGSARSTPASSASKPSPRDRQDAEQLNRLFNQRKEAESQQAALVSMMRRENPQYVALKYPRPCSIEQARACLAADEVALLYVLGSEASYLIVVTKAVDPGATGVAIFELKGAAEIAKVVDLLRSEGARGILVASRPFAFPSVCRT